MGFTVNRVGVTDDDPGQDLVAHVRLAEGGTVKLHSGDTVPAEADPDHVAFLLASGVIDGTADEKVPVTVDEILDAVGDDAELANAYLLQESGKEKPRPSLIAKLEAIANTGPA